MRFYWTEPCLRKVRNQSRAVESPQNYTLFLIPSFCKLGSELELLRIRVAYLLDGRFRRLHHSASNLTADRQSKTLSDEIRWNQIKSPLNKINFSKVKKYVICKTQTLVGVYFFTSLTSKNKQLRLSYLPNISIYYTRPFTTIKTI